ncbi:MAG: hypothetical protein IPO62_00015 [Saprospiraceae bacterium]|nr:hypothetical protein [Saprospiraceae bacterium]
MKKFIENQRKMENDATCFVMAEATIGVVPDHLRNPEAVFELLLARALEEAWGQW